MERELNSDDQTADATQKSGTGVIKILTPLTPSLVKFVNLHVFNKFINQETKMYYLVNGNHKRL
jgi:hypothetical protein